MKTHVFLAGRLMALVVLLLAVGCARQAPASAPAAPTALPTSSATLPAATPAPATATPQPSPAPVSPIQTPGPLSPLATPGKPASAPAASGGVGAPVDAVRAAVAAQVGVNSDLVQVQQVEAVEWPDACLGVQVPDTMCAQVITPGFRIVFSTPNGTVEVHTDQTGNAVRVVTP